MYGTQNIKPLELTSEWLFDRINQEDVFLRYFGFCDLNSKYCNPLRPDQNPDCRFYWYNGVLFFNDIARKKAYTCINVVMEIEALSYRKALDKIYSVFIDNGNISQINTNRTLRSKQTKDIKCKVQPFTETDIQYLKSFGITSEFCKKAKWFSIKHYWIDGKLQYTYSDYNPCIGYYFEGRWKLYFYKNKFWRFLGNTNKNDIQGYNILPESGEILVITKSFKDIGTLYEQNIPSIAPQAESIVIQKDIMSNLKQRFKFIYTLMDYDNAGIHLSWEMRKLYNTKPLFFTDKLWNRKGGYMGCKDASDYYKKFGKFEFEKLIENAKTIYCI